MWNIFVRLNSVFGYYLLKLVYDSFHELWKLIFVVRWVERIEIHFYFILPGYRELTKYCIVKIFFFVRNENLFKAHKTHKETTIDYRKLFKTCLIIIIMKTLSQSPLYKIHC